MTEAPGIPELLTITEVAKALKIHRTTVYRRSYRYTMEGANRRYYASDIRLQLLLNTHAPDAKPRKRGSKEG